ncbi:hypothetical protein QAD02_010771 [Eretmocerus hayati]|uniref:Uncharacterized protein n=1 Tax=Eretmocerus hayati TaxID=131215 RepID=A0ACC2NZM3_9HYME|nr:hypothetical protein QAD02_010771 [Eretmocerus hayati]
MSLPREWSLHHGHHQLSAQLSSNTIQQYQNQQQQNHQDDQKQWHQMDFFEDEIGPKHGSDTWSETPATANESAAASMANANTANCSIDENAVMGQQHANLLGSLFSVHSAPVYELASSANGNGNGSPSRPVSLVVQATATSTPVVPPHLSPPDDDEDTDNLLTISSVTARPLIAKSRELGSSRSGQAGNRRRGNDASAKKKQQQLASAKKKSKKRKRRRPEYGQYEPLDGGYGWAVVFGAFFVQFWVAGLVKSYGVLYVEVMETFENSSASLASWIPAILSCLCLALAPVTSMLSQKYSCRKVVFVGGLFCSLGLITSYFATSLIHLFFTFGVLTGIGGGLSTTPGIILVSQYFESHRALANGIVVSGTAAGGFVFPLLIEYLVGAYGFHGTLLILGGCMLHVCASASMYRPLYKNYPEPRSRTEDEQVKAAEESRQIDEMEKKQDGIEARHRLEMLFAQNDSTAKNNALNELFHQNNTHVNAELAIQLTDSEEEKDTIGVPPMNFKPIHKIRSSSLLHSVEDLSTDSTCFYKSRSSQRSLRASSALAMGGSVNLPQPQQQHQNQQRSRSLTLAEQTASKESLAQRIVASRYIELGLLRDSRFIAMGLSVTLMSAGSPYMLYYLPKYVNDMGYTKTEAGYLVAISAAFDLCGRLGLGYLSDLQLFDRRKTYIASIVGAGIAVLIIPVANSFTILAACVSVYGLLLGCWFLLIPVLLADQFGTEKISSSYGLVRMFQSIGAITVPPLSGYLCDLTKSYIVVFLFMGTCMVLGGTPLLLVNSDDTKSVPDDETKSKQEPTSASATAVKA